MNEQQEKTPTISASTAKMSLAHPPYGSEDNSEDDAPDNSDTNGEKAPQAYQRMSGLSSEEEEEVSTPRSSIKRVDVGEETPVSSGAAAMTVMDSEIPEQPQLSAEGTEPTADELVPVKGTEDLTPVQEYAVMTAPPASSRLPSAAGVPPRSSKLRSPRPRPPRVRAVDWCPGGSIRSTGPTTSTTPTVATSRAVRGDDATITTYATMTTIGDATSILEASSESDSDGEGSVGSNDNAGENMLNASVASGITDMGVTQLKDDRSVVSYNTMNTGMDLGSIWEELPKESLVDKLPSMTSTPGTSVISGATSRALRDPEDRSFVSLNMNQTEDFRKQRVEVDKLPSMTSTPGTSVISGATSRALRDPDDRSLYSLNTNVTGGINTYDYGTMNFETQSHLVDRTPSNAASMSGTTQRSLMGDEDSDATFSTMNTAGRERTFSYTNIPGHLVDHVPDETEEESVSGKTDRAVRNKEDQSVATWNTFTTGNVNFNDEVVVVDGMPSSKASVVSGTTNQAVNDEQSVATWNTVTTMNTSGRDSRLSNIISVNIAGDVVDHFPDEKEEEEEETGSVSGRTDRAVRTRDDQSVATWNTFTTGNVNFNDEVVVDVIPSSRQSVVSGTTNHALNDEQSVATWNTMTTAGAGLSSVHAVDRVPSLANNTDASISGTTNRAVRAPDDQSVVTFATQTTFGGDRGNRVVDHVPSISEMMASNRDSESNTNHAIGGSQSVATWTTMNTIGNNQLTGNVVDRIPSFLVEENAPSSVLTTPTTNAVQEDRSVITFATTTTSGERGIQHVVDGIPTFAGGGGRSVASGITNQAVRMNDDRSLVSFNTMTTSGDFGSIYEHGKDFDEDAVDEDRREKLLSGNATGRDMSDEGEDEDVATSASSSSRPIAPSGILREGRHNRHSIQSTSSAVTGINAGESVSNTHILRAITELRLHVDYRMEELRQVGRRDAERVIQIVQQEQAKRTALESRLHSQLLLQSESMVAMELKLLRLEAKVAHRELHRQRRQPGIGSMPVTDRLPPIAATSSPNRSDEEVDSFEELDLTPRANRQGLGSSTFSQGGVSRGPANIAVVTRSGASVASAVTATSFADGDFAHLHDDEERSEGSEDGDVEDGMDDHNDGSESTPTHGSNNRISNLESILLNPLAPTGSNDQGISTRATRGETDGMSSLPTSVTSATMASTVVTSTTRGESVGVGIMRMSSRASEDEMLPESHPELNEASSNAAASAQRSSVNRSSRNRFGSDEIIDIDGTQQDHARSRSQSPLTVQSAATETIGTQSVASVSVGPSILSTAAVASSRSFGTRRANAAMAAFERNAEGRPLANRVVSFTTNDTLEQSQPPQENDGGGDSITMPDELDTFSDIADAFSNSARHWREEYEARLNEIHKQIGN